MLRTLWQASTSKKMFGTDGIQFNVSHSQKLALYAVTRGREIGVDLEYVHPIVEIDQVAEQPKPAS